jgi:hypothetical protein
MASVFAAHGFAPSQAEAAADLSGSISRDVEGLELAQAMMSDLWR